MLRALLVDDVFGWRAGLDDPAVAPGPVAAEALVATDAVCEAAAVPDDPQPQSVSAMSPAAVAQVVVERNP